MSAINGFHFIGRCGGNPKSSATRDGTIVSNVSIAVQEYYQKNPNWINLTAFGKPAEALNSHAKQGSLIAVSGHVRVSSYEKDGQKRTSIEFVVDEWSFVGGNGEGKNGNGASAQNKANSFDDDGDPFDGEGDPFDF